MHTQFFIRIDVMNTTKCVYVIMSLVVDAYNRLLHDILFNIINCEHFENK